MTDLISTARGCVNTWQCDENDHLNVQYFPAFAWDGARHLHAALGLGPRALAAQGLKVRTVEDHIRYHRELFAADAFEVASGPVEIGESTMVAYHEIRNALDGAVGVAAEMEAWQQRTVGVAFLRLHHAPHDGDKPGRLGAIKRQVGQRPE